MHMENALSEGYIGITESSILLSDKLASASLLDFKLRMRSGIISWKVRLHQLETMQWKPKWIFLDVLVKELKGVETKDRIYQMSGWLLFNVGCLSFAFVALRSLFERQVHSHVTEKEIENNSYMASVLTVWDNNIIIWTELNWKTLF